eukprot:6088717-Prymnesium_polylepis.1
MAMQCTDAPTIGSGWGLHGIVFTAVGGLRTLACDPGYVYITTTGKGLTKPTSATAPVLCEPWPSPSQRSP